MGKASLKIYGKQKSIEKEIKIPELTYYKKKQKKGEKITNS